MPTDSHQHLSTRFKEIDNKVEIGIDEAGRGCFWGPIMAGAVVWPSVEKWTPDHWDIAGDIKDSKKIAEKKRRKIAAEIKRLASGWGVGSVSAAEIDEFGITWANKEAFRRAIAAVPENILWERIVIDGAISIEPPMAGIEVVTVVDGDANYLHIAAASIIAKVEHDDWIEEYCRKDTICAERYCLLTSHGYGTAKHREGLRANGAHEHHRRTFIYRWLPVPVPRPREEKCLIKLSMLPAGATQNGVEPV
jgi:ribonuclease HII